MIGGIEKRIDLGDSHLLRSVRYLLDSVSGPDFAFLDYPKIETRPSMGHEKSRQLRFIQTQADLVASHSGLADLEDAAPDPKAIANANFGVRQTFNCEVFTEIAVS
jgi:hypothetical protein